MPADRVAEIALLSALKSVHIALAELNWTAQVRVSNVIFAFQAKWKMENAFIIPPPTVVAGGIIFYC